MYREIKWRLKCFGQTTGLDSVNVCATKRMDSIDLNVRKLFGSLANQHATYLVGDTTSDSWTQSLLFCTVIFNKQFYLWNAVASWNTVRVCWGSLRLRFPFLLWRHTLDRFHDCRCCTSRNRLWIKSQEMKLFNSNFLIICTKIYFRSHSSLWSTSTRFSGLPPSLGRCWWRFWHPVGSSSGFSLLWLVDSGTKPVADEVMSRFHSELDDVKLTWTIRRLSPVSLAKFSRTLRQGFGDTSNDALNARRCCVFKMVRGRFGPRRPSIFDGNMSSA